VDAELKAVVQAALGRRVLGAEPLSGGCIARVYSARMESADDVVVKVCPGGSSLPVEAFMLGYLRSRTGLPVPAVLHAGTGLLILEHMPGASVFGEAAQRHAADLLADLHEHSADAFGFERDTVIGPLAQRNPWTASWPEFFAENRVRAMADDTAAHGRISPRLHDRLHRAADACARLLREPGAPSLLHGDVWAGNVLASGDRVTAFLDPAIYYGHAEVELAFITLFGTFGPAFFERYGRRRPIEPGFFEKRAAVYNLYPLLVHARLFGGGYPGMIDASLGSLGL
jgi:fructosamine-3-kinase